MKTLLRMALGFVLGWTVGYLALSLALQDCRLTVWPAIWTGLGGLLTGTPWGSGRTGSSAWAARTMVFAGVGVFLANLHAVVFTYDSLPVIPGQFRLLLNRPRLEIVEMPVTRNLYYYVWSHWVSWVALAITVCALGWLVYERLAFREPRGGSDGGHGHDE